jgi:hypothetical protein
MLDVVMNFDYSHFKVISFWLMALAVMPMLLAFAKDRELTWQPAKWLSLAILMVCLVHLFLPGFTAERPRDMTLMYSEIEGADAGYLVLESIYRRHDKEYAKSQGFEMMELNSGRLGSVERPVREVALLGLPAVEMVEEGVRAEDKGWHRELRIDLPANSHMLRLTIPKSIGLEKAWVNGELALDLSIESKYERSVDSLELVYPGAGPVTVGLQTTGPEAFTIAAVSWYDLPDALVAPFMDDWPDDAQPFMYGPRAEKIQEFELGAAQ